MRATTILRAALSLLPLALASCRGMDSRCSDAEVISTVKSLSGENTDNPVLSKLFAALHTTFALDAIRTVSSSSAAAVCEARLTIRFQVPQDAGRTSSPPGQAETTADRSMREQMMAQLATRVHEIMYRVEKTDDGQSYVTIIPPDADSRSQDLQQQQEQQLEQNRRGDVEREMQRQQDEQRTRDWQQRQQQLEQQAPRE